MSSVRYRRILLAVGPGRPHRVVPVAARLALASDAEVIVAHVRAVEADAETREEAHRLVDAEVERLRGWRVKARGEVFSVRQETAAEELAELARSYSADLVAVGFHSRTLVGALLSLGTAYRTIALVRCPVLVASDQPVTGERPIAGAPAELRRLLLAVERLPESQPALDSAQRLAERTGAAVSIVHVTEVVDDAHLRSEVEAGERGVREAEAQLRRAGVRVGEVVAAERGGIARRVAEAAETVGADLLVVGSSRAPGRSGLAAGSIGHDLPGLTGRPILIVGRRRRRDS